MAGQTKGTYSKSIPEPPVMDFAYLKSWFDVAGPRRQPVNAEKRKKYLWQFYHDDRFLFVEAHTRLQALLVITKKLHLANSPHRHHVRKVT
jgi:hypothetical protein